jgi:hypothetical protein
MGWFHKPAAYHVNPEEKHWLARLKENISEVERIHCSVSRQ